jgi:hypothetical protein
MALKDKYTYPQFFETLQCFPSSLGQIQNPMGADQSEKDASGDNVE